MLTRMANDAVKSTRMMRRGRDAAIVPVVRVLSASLGECYADFCTALDENGPDDPDKFNPMAV